MPVGTKAEECLMRTLLTVLLILFPPSVMASELRITVEGIRSSHGTILIGLYDSLETFTRAIELSDKDGFLNDPNRFAAVALRANVAMKSAVVLTNLAPGSYAIIVFHDENGNGKLDKNALGVLLLWHSFDTAQNVRAKSIGYRNACYDTHFRNPLILLNSIDLVPQQEYPLN